MKLQYLGDARDAFKWDFLHWLCTHSTPGFDKLVFVPMLTPDIENSNEGKILHQQFDCRGFIRPFLDSLIKNPRSLERISSLGKIDQSRSSFDVEVFAPTKYIVSGRNRANYWDGFAPEQFENAVIFFDPDNGFETQTRHGTKWLRHSELKQFLFKLPKTSIAVVYQHRPHRTWNELFSDLNENLSYAHTAVASYEGNLAFVAMAANGSAGNRMISAMKDYTNNHSVVSYKVLRGYDLD